MWSHAGAHSHYIEPVIGRHIVVPSWSQDEPDIMRFRWRQKLWKDRGIVSNSRSRDIDPVALRESLGQRGVPAEFHDVITARLEDDLQGLSGPSRKAMLDGVALSFSAQQGFSAQLAGSVRELREVERMMGAFSGELSKLDEVLEVLAAYVQRMRSSGASTDHNRVLH